MQIGKLLNRSSKNDVIGYCKVVCFNTKWRLETGHIKEKRQLYSFCFSNVWSMSHQQSTGQVKNKECYFMFCGVFYLISFFDKVSNLHSRILTNQNRELVKKNFEWNCMIYMFLVARSVGKKQVEQRVQWIKKKSFSLVFSVSLLYRHCQRFVTLVTTVAF